MDTDLILETGPDESWIEKYRAALAAQDNRTPPPGSFEKLLAPWTNFWVKARCLINRLFEYRARTRTENGTQPPIPQADQPSTAVSEILIQGMKRVEMLRRQSPKKAVFAKSFGANKSSKNIA
jgi:hypothetical protein